MNTVSALRVKGHARSVQAANVHRQGMFAIADQYDVICACGWQARVADLSAARPAHEAHKAAVLNGTHADARQVEAARRLAMYADLLADDAALTRSSLTREQVEGWVAQIEAGDWK